MTDVPSELLWLECDMCGQNLTSKSDNMKLSTGGIRCPDPGCDKKLGPDNIVAKYEPSEVLRSKTDG